MSGWMRVEPAPETCSGSAWWRQPVVPRTAARTRTVIRRCIRASCGHLAAVILLRSNMWQGRYEKNVGMAWLVPASCFCGSVKAEGFGHDLLGGAHVAFG